MAVELPAVLLLAVAIVFWFDTARAREQVCAAVRRHCRERGLTLLDDTVVMKSLRLRRDMRGRVRFARRYHFEFSSDGAERYRGRVSLCGNRIDAIEMEPWRERIGHDQ